MSQLVHGIKLHTKNVYTPVFRIFDILTIDRMTSFIRAWKLVGIVARGMGNPSHQFWCF